MVKLRGYPSALVHAAKNKKNVQKVMKAEYPNGVLPYQLPVFDPEGSFCIEPPKMKCKKPLRHRPLHPPFMAASFCHVNTMWGQKAIIKAWDGIKSLGVQQVKHYTSCNEANCSFTPAYHFGIWQVQQPCPIVTRETRLQKPAGLKAIDSLISAVTVTLFFSHSTLLLHSTMLPFHIIPLSRCFSFTSLAPHVLLISDSFQLTFPWTFLSCTFTLGPCSFPLPI